MALDHIAAIKELNLSLGSYLVVGGSCLAVRRIRESNDIDMVVMISTFRELQERGWEVDSSFKEKWNRERLKQGYFEVYTDMIVQSENRLIPASELIPTAEIIEGVPFLSLEKLLFFKRDNARSKDLADIALIESYLQTHA